MRLVPYWNWEVQVKKQNPSEQLDRFGDAGELEPDFHAPFLSTLLP